MIYQFVGFVTMSGGDADDGDDADGDDQLHCHGESDDTAEEDKLEPAEEDNVGEASSQAQEAHELEGEGAMLAGPVPEPHHGPDVPDGAGVEARARDARQPAPANHRWGQYRFTLKRSGRAGGPPVFHWECHCPYHAKSHRTGCKKTLVIHEGPGESWEEASHAVLLRLRAWAIAAVDHDRQRYHLLSPARVEHPPENILEAQRPAWDDGFVLRTDESLDEAEEAAQAAHAKAKARAQAKPKAKRKAAAKIAAAAAKAKGKGAPQAKRALAKSAASSSSSQRNTAESSSSSSSNNVNEGADRDDHESHGGPASVAQRAASNSSSSSSSSSSASSSSSTGRSSGNNESRNNSDNSRAGSATNAVIRRPRAKAKRELGRGLA